MFVTCFYRFDDYVYCDCGRVSVVELKFTCNSKNHMIRCLTYSENNIKNLLASLEPYPEYNILLLGESGVGKSTTINALANYTKYHSFGEACDGKFTQLIPASFTLPHPKIRNKTCKIETGKDVNERHDQGGNSCTQAPKTYRFFFGKQVIQIIDTPGIGDTGGVLTDQQNFKQIMNYLHAYRQLQGICVLIKSTETRKNTIFRYCINELLTYLHKSACPNIVFCFTFARSSLFGPGDGFQTLEGFLNDDLFDVELGLVPDENCFFLDNQAFQFMAAKKDGYPFTDDEIGGYKDCWDNSVKQINLMLEHLLSVPTHNLEVYCSIVSQNIIDKIIFCYFSANLQSKPSSKLDS